MLKIAGEFGHLKLAMRFHSQVASSLPIVKATSESYLAQMLNRRSSIVSSTMRGRDICLANCGFMIVESSIVLYYVPA